MNFLTIQEHHVTDLPSVDGLPERCHEFDEPSIAAVNAAIAAKRPLLIRGEPGVGKTQLAEAVALELQRAYYSFVVNARTEPHDLLWRFDAVMRLAEAQLCSVAKPGDLASARMELAVEKFVRPGPLWWAFDSESAAAACRDGQTPLDNGHNEKFQQNGWVVLIDEIDKAESDVPNGLLEALGSSRFVPFGHEKPVTVKDVAPPLVIITTNEERVLPHAFVRRCLVLHLSLPDVNTPDGEQRLIRQLCSRGRAHFGKRTGGRKEKVVSKTNDEVLQAAARQLVADRKSADQQQLRPLPGQAEYLDLVRAVVEQAPRRPDEQLKLLKSAARFTLQKHLDVLKTPQTSAQEELP